MFSSCVSPKCVGTLFMGSFQEADSFRGPSASFLSGKVLVLLSYRILIYALLLIHLSKE